MKLKKRASCFLNMQHLDCHTVYEQRQQRMRFIYFFIRYSSNIQGQGCYSIDGPFNSSHVFQLGFFGNQHINKKHFIILE